MDKKPASGNRIHFRSIVTGTTLLVMGTERQAVVFVNEGTTAVRLGHSGTVATLGLYLNGATSFADNYSKDEYWAYVSSGSGTISGFIVP
jgi:hypothetical protein